MILKAVGFILSMLLSGVSLTSAHADFSAQYPTLYAHTYRPTPEQFMAALGGQLPEGNVFLRKKYYCEELKENQSGTEVDAIGAKVIKEIPSLIARLEAAYPGATYFFLGRDAMLLSDILETYYQSIGQFHRVVRLHASTATVNGMDDQQGMDFLVSNGFNRNPSAPTVIVDQTDFLSTSQSHKVYDWMVAIRKGQGFTDEQVRQSVGVASTGKVRDVGGKGRWKITSEAEGQELKQKYSADYALSVDINRTYIMYYGFWNNSYSAQLTVDDGVPKGVPTSDYGNDSKSLVLATMYEGIWAALNPEFHERVIKQAEAYGATTFLAYLDGRAESIYKNEAVRAQIIERARLTYLDRFPPNEELPKVLWQREVEAEFDQVMADLLADSKPRLGINWSTVDNGIIAYLDRRFPAKNGADKLRNYIRLLESNPSRGAYLSTNGLLIQERIKGLVAALNPMEYAEFVAVSASVLSEALRNEKITAKDFRRLFLYLFSRLDAQDSAQMQVVGGAIASVPALKEMLIQHWVPFMTSLRYGAQPKFAYESLISHGFLFALPKGECDAAVVGREAA